MKNLSYLIVFLVVSASISSCKPIYKCGEQKPAKKLFLPKMIQVVINERDSLCTTLSAREADIVDFKNKINTLNESNAGLKTELEFNNKTLNDVLDEKLSQSEQYGITLKKKTDELQEKERLLIEREGTLKEMQKVIARQDSITSRLNNILRDALLGFKSDELSVEIKNGKVYVSMSDKLLFKSGSAAIESKGIEAIKLLSDVLIKNSDIDVLVEGHTDNVPIKTALYKDNWDLSVARATSIVRILTDEYKVPPTRLTASGRGEFLPRANNATLEGRANNRRTEIILSPKLDEIMKLLKTN